MVKKISRDKLKEMMVAREKFFLLDARSKESYGKEHIMKALSMPVEEAEKLAPAFLEKNDTIVSSCGSLESQASARLAEKLVKMGYKDVYEYEGGLADWKQAGLPTEASP